jgi:hypothetical protein
VKTAASTLATWQCHRCPACLVSAASAADMPHSSTLDPVNRLSPAACQRQCTARPTLQVENGGRRQVKTVLVCHALPCTHRRGSSTVPPTSLGSGQLIMPSAACRLLLQLRISATALMPTWLETDPEP